MALEKVPRTFLMNNYESITDWYDHFFSRPDWAGFVAGR
jgi:hypothetical protein